ncbi:MAG: phosphatase PAP2 family protein [Lachnospiraceae bacterium]|nr:phosphatase PAP2 family protein [Lachnospiraceae bacterium]
MESSSESQKISGSSPRKVTNYKHAWLILGWPCYLTMFYLTGKYIPFEKCHIVHSVIDDLVPFNEVFILAYVSWYFLLASSLLYLLFTDAETFKRAQIMIIASQVIGIAIIILWPSAQLLRPDPYPRDNIFTDLVRLIQSVDPPTCVLPSEHVALSLSILSAWWWKKDAKLWVKLFYTVWVVLICISVLFVKQHSFTDVWVAFLMVLVIEIVYDVLKRYGNGKEKMG